MEKLGLRGSQMALGANTTASVLNTYDTAQSISLSFVLNEWGHAAVSSQ